MNVLACFVASNLFFTRRVSSASPVSVQTGCEVYSPIVVFFSKDPKNTKAVKAIKPLCT